MSNESSEPTVSSQNARSSAQQGQPNLDNTALAQASGTSEQATATESQSTSVAANAAQEPLEGDSQLRRPKIQVGSRYSARPRPGGDRPPVGNRGGDRPPRRDKPPRHGGGQPNKQKPAEGGESKSENTEKT